MLEIKDLCKTYIVNKRQNNVLKNVNLSIHEGEMVGIMGPSGSGKSTLLYTVSGMDSVTAGTVDFEGRNLAKMSSSEIASIRLEEMGFIFQQMYMMKNLSIMDNILLPALQSKRNTTSRSEKKEFARQMMQKLDIIDIADNDITEVSGGQLQRACICRSMMNHPKIIFADEPTGALNSTSADAVLDILTDINKQGQSIVMVTHDKKTARRANRILYLKDGVILDELDLGVYEKNKKERHDKLNQFLEKMGW